MAPGFADYPYTTVIGNGHDPDRARKLLAEVDVPRQSEVLAEPADLRRGVGDQLVGALDVLDDDACHLCSLHCLFCRPVDRATPCVKGAWGPPETCK